MRSKLVEKKMKGDKLKKKIQFHKSSQIKLIVIKRTGIKYEEITK
jgi:hypothetical protein